MTSCSNANGGDFQRIGNGLSHVGGDALQNDAKCPRLLKAEGLIEELPRSDGRASLCPESADDGDGLGRQTDVAHDGDASLRHLPDRLGTQFAPTL